MAKWKGALLFIGGLILGIIVVDNNNTAPIHSPTSLEWAQQGVDDISRLSDPKDQLAAAEAYYGKAVVLFLASLVNRTQSTPTTPTTTVAEVESPEVINPEKSSEVKSNPTVSENRELTPQERKAQDEMNKQQSDLDRLISFKKSAYANKLGPQVRRMQGYFVGQLIHQNARHKGRIDPMSVLIDLVEERGKLTGKALIVLTDPDGKEYSRANNTGENQSLRLVPGRRDQIYLVPAPGDFILLDIRNENRLQGVYYDENGAYLGKVVLNRS